MENNNTTLPHYYYVVVRPKERLFDWSIAKELERIGMIKDARNLFGLNLRAAKEFVESEYSYKVNVHQFHTLISKANTHGYCVVVIETRTKHFDEYDLTLNTPF